MRRPRHTNACFCLRSLHDTTAEIFVRAPQYDKSVQGVDTLVRRLQRLRSWVVRRCCCGI